MFLGYLTLGMWFLYGVMFAIFLSCHFVHCFISCKAFCDMCLSVLAIRVHFVFFLSVVL